MGWEPPQPRRTCAIDHAVRACTFKRLGGLARVGCRRSRRSAGSDPGLRLPPETGNTPVAVDFASRHIWTRCVSFRTGTKSLARRKRPADHLPSPQRQPDEQRLCGQSGNVVLQAEPSMGSRQVDKHVLNIGRPDTQRIEGKARRSGAPEPHERLWISAAAPRSSAAPVPYTRISGAAPQGGTIATKGRGAARWNTPATA